MNGIINVSLPNVSAKIPDNSQQNVLNPNMYAKETERKKDVLYISTDQTDNTRQSDE